MMTSFNFTEFSANLQKDFLKVSSTLSNLEDFAMQGAHEDQREMEEEFLEYTLNRIRLKIEFAYSYLGLDVLFTKLQEDLAEYHNKFDTTKSHPIVDVIYSPVEIILHNHFDAIMCHKNVEKEDESERLHAIANLERILGNSAKIIYELKLMPSSEADIRNAIFPIIRYSFPDAVREFPIKKISRNNKPDIGIQNLKIGIEYKYANSKQEMKSALGGIFEDIHGYEGTENWKNFYAVFYMTDNFMTQEEVELEFKHSKVPDNWKPIVIIGKGVRKKKKEMNK